MRTFTAIDLDPAVRRQLATVQNRLNSHLSDVRWVDPQKIHLTLKFLGEIRPEDAARVGDALAVAAARCAPFEIGIEKNVGVFPPHGPPRVIWVGIRDPNGSLRRCHDACEAALEQIGFPREGRAFQPHLTLGRSRCQRGGGKTRSTVAEFNVLDFPVQEISSLTFYESTLTDSGPIYRVLSRHALGNAL